MLLRPPVRLMLAAAMASLLLLSLSYWWLENFIHEIFGTAMLVLMAWHIWSNGRWFGNLFRGSYDGRRTVTVALHGLLMVNMAVLVVTSVIISKSLFASLPIPDSVYLSEIHWLSAYWVMIAVGIHLGLHWLRVMIFVRTTLNLRPSSVFATAVLRCLAAGLLVFGIWSGMVLGVMTKLTFNYSLDFWDFNASVTPFFLHWAGVVCVPAILTHYARILAAGRRTRVAAA